MTNEAKLQQTVSAPKTKKRKVASLDKKKARAGWVFVLPFVIGFVLVYLPIIWNSIFMSFHSLHIVTGGGYTLEFVGLENYSDALFEDPLFVQTLITGLKELAFDTNRTAILCGPPIMIKFCLQGLKEMGFAMEQVYTTLELRMKCGIGKCGRCNIGTKYVCKDGPVFRFDQVDAMPNEY